MDWIPWGNSILEAVKPIVIALVTLLVAGTVGGASGFILAERFVPRSVAAIWKRLVATLGSCGSLYFLNRADWLPGFTWSANSWMLVIVGGVLGSAASEWMHDNDALSHIPGLSWVKRQPVRGE